MAAATGAAITQRTSTVMATACRNEMQPCIPNRARDFSRNPFLFFPTRSPGHDISGSFTLTSCPGDGHQHCKESEFSEQEEEKLGVLQDAAP